jgi:hypothetical protein
MDRAATTAKKHLWSSVPKPRTLTLSEGILSLRKLPNRGRHAAVEATRELQHERLPYIVAYRVKKDVVEILHIWHPSPRTPLAACLKQTGRLAPPRKLRTRN